MRIDALYADYDGTLAPIGVPRAASRIPRRLRGALAKVAARVPIAIVTAKDYDFVQPRTKFATAWACASGLEVRLADGTVWTHQSLGDLRDALLLGLEARASGVETELKHGSRGKVLGISLDWSGNGKPTRSLLEGLFSLQKKGLFVAYDGYSNYADVYAGEPDKGRALRVLNSMLGVKGATMFIGDSPLDNPAFRQAEVAVGVDHGQPMEGLECGFVVEQQHLERVLRSLSDRGMQFMASMPRVRKKE